MDFFQAANGSFSSFFDEAAVSRKQRALYCTVITRKARYYAMIQIMLTSSDDKKDVTHKPPLTRAACICPYLAVELSWR